MAWANYMANRWITRLSNHYDISVPVVHFYENYKTTRKGTYVNGKIIIYVNNVDEKSLKHDICHEWEHHYQVNRFPHLAQMHKELLSELNIENSDFDFLVYWYSPLKLDARLFGYSLGQADFHKNLQTMTEYYTSVRQQPVETIIGISQLTGLKAPFWFRQIYGTVNSETVNNCFWATL